MATIHQQVLPEGRVHIMDVWESQEAYDEFNEERLSPAIKKVTEAHGIDTSQGPGPVGTVSEVHCLVRGS